MFTLHTHIQVHFNICPRVNTHVCTVLRTMDGMYTNTNHTTEKYHILFGALIAATAEMGQFYLFFS